VGGLEGDEETLREKEELFSVTVTSREGAFSGRKKK